MEKWRPYLPVVGLVMAAYVALAVPVFTAFLVASVLLLLAAGYGWVVYQLTRKSASGYGHYRGSVYDPSFRNVTTVMRTRWVRD